MFGITKPKTAIPEVKFDVDDIDIPDFEDDLTEALEASGEAAVTDETRKGMALAEDVLEQGSQVAVTESRQSSITQASLAALVAFESEMRDSAAGLEVLNTTMAAIGAAHETANRLIGSLRAGVLRANDIEEANVAFSTNNRRLSEQLEQARHLQSQLESVDEASKRRIELLIKDYNEVKIALGRSQIEAIEARDALTEAESEKTTLIYELATKTTTADRLARENELLRQKCVNQQISLTAVEQRHSELEMKLDETAAIRKAETAEMAGLRMRYENTEKECRRLQKQSELSQVRFAESQERIMTIEANLEELRERHGATNERFRSEAEVMKARLETVIRKGVADTEEIAMLKQQLGDALAAVGLMEARLACAHGQIDAQRKKGEQERGNETSKVIGIASYDRGRQGKKAKGLTESDQMSAVRTRQKH
jgi:hypothetical protein